MAYTGMELLQDVDDEKKERIQSVFQRLSPFVHCDFLTGPQET